MEATVNIIKGDTIGIEVEYKDSMPVNMYAVQKEVLGANGYLVCSPGLVYFGDVYGIDRGAVYNERLDIHFRVSGHKLLSINRDGSYNILGSIPGHGRVSMPYSFNTQAVIAEGRMFLYSPLEGLLEITESDLGNPLDAVWIDGYYLMVDGENVYHTDIADEANILPLAFGTAEFMPDESLAIAKTQDNKAVIFGRKSIEYFEDISAENFAFQRIPSRAQKVGIVGTHAVCESSGVFYIVGGRENESIGVHVVNIGVTQKISTKDVDTILAQYNESELYQIRVEARKERDTSFIIVHLPSHTLCFNETIAGKLGVAYAWTELRTDEGEYRAMNGVFDPRISKFVYGDKFTNKICTLDRDIFSQYGIEQEFIFDTPFMALNGKSIDQIELNTIPGRNEKNDATVAFSLTTDGITYSQESWRLYGENSEYNRRFIALRLGYVSNWCGFRFRGRTTSRLSFSGLRVEYA